MGRADQGTQFKRYTLIPRSLVFLFRGSHVLMLKGAETKRLWAGKYNGIGGHIERGEDVLSAARREIDEETRLEPDYLWLCGVITINTGDEAGIVIFVFKGESTSGDPVDSLEGRLEWIDVNSLDEYPLVEDLYQLLPRIVKKKKGDNPFIASYEYDRDDRLVVRFSAD